jgi:hypothetical protein
MNALAHQRCFHHYSREAVARCPQCAHFYCRECITEHEDRIICAACLKRLAAGEVTSRRGLTPLIRVTQFTVGFVLLFLMFYLFGQVLISIPAKYHEGTVWNDRWWKE